MLRQPAAHLFVQACDRIAARRGVTVRIDPINADQPAHCAPTIVDAIEAACDRRGLRYRRMISRAYHDALFMSRVTAMGMIFIPCRDGISHVPEEYASPEAISRGAEVLGEVLASLALFKGERDRGKGEGLV